MISPPLIRMKRTRRTAGFQMLPMIDVIFLILCAVSVAAIPSDRWMKIPVDLSSSDNANLKQLRAPSSISVNAEGDFLIDSIKAGEDAIARHIQILSRGEDKAFGIAADSRAPHGKVLRLLDLAKEHGITDAYFIIQEEQSQH